MTFQPLSPVIQQQVGITDLLEAIKLQTEVTKAHTKCMAEVNEKLAVVLSTLTGLNTTRERWYLIIILTLVVALGAAAGLKITMPVL